MEGTQDETSTLHAMLSRTRQLFSLLHVCLSEWKGKKRKEKEAQEKQKQKRNEQATKERQQDALQSKGRRH
eukprot:m.197794 g.197794  ORF g.197794 m.197794 type:complete len:71 (-) comp16827_c0_seq7:160-372(-)